MQMLPVYVGSVKDQDQPKIERLVNDDARLILRNVVPRVSHLTAPDERPWERGWILRRKRGNDMIESKLKARNSVQPRTLSCFDFFGSRQYGEDIPSCQTNHRG